MTHIDCPDGFDGVKRLLAHQDAVLAVVDAARAVAKSARRNHKGRFTQVDHRLQAAVEALERLER